MDFLPKHREESLEYHSLNHSHPGVASTSSPTDTHAVNQLRGNGKLTPDLVGTYTLEIVYQSTYTEPLANLGPCLS